MPATTVADASTDADLEGGRGEFEVMIFCGGLVALALGLLGLVGRVVPNLRRFPGSE